MKHDVIQDYQAS